jgi:hypothetical protein
VTANNIYIVTDEEKAFLIIDAAPWYRRFSLLEPSDCQRQV